MTVAQMLAYVFLAGVASCVVIAAVSFLAWVVSSFFAGVKQMREDDEPCEYFDPGFGGKPRW